MFLELNKDENVHRFALRGELLEIEREITTMTTMKTTRKRKRDKCNYKNIIILSITNEFSLI